MDGSAVLGGYLLDKVQSYAVFKHYVILYDWNSVLKSEKV